jgi:hypothetical protein
VHVARGASGYPDNSIVHLIRSEIRLQVTPETKTHIAALQNMLSKLESKAIPGRDEEAFAELKRILNNRIEELESCGSIAPVQHSIENSRDAD